MAESGTEKLILDHYRQAGHWRGIIEGCNALAAGDTKAKVAIVLSGLSSGLSGSKLHLYAMGKSQGGKSWTQRRIGQYLFENFESVSSSSSKAPYYKSKKDPTCFKNTVRLYDEFADQTEEFQNQIKAFTSQGVDCAVLETVDTKREFLRAVIQGLPVVWTNSALPIEGPGAEQILNRFWKINIDESPEQDTLVQEYQRSDEKYGDWTKREKQRIDSAKSEISSILSAPNVEVLNPFADSWNVRCAANRNFRPMIANIVRVFAYSNRTIRHHIDANTILATLADNIMAFYSWSFFEVYQLKKVPARYLKMLNALVPEQPYAKEELSHAFSEKYPIEPRLSPETCYQYAHYLEKMGLMGSRSREHSKEVEFYALVAARSSSHPVYDNGALASLVFESLEFKFPTTNELANTVQGMRSASLAPWGNTESDGKIASDLLDWDFVMNLAKTLEVPLPERTGHNEKTSSASILDFTRDDKLANLAPKSLEEQRQ